MNIVEKEAKKCSRSFYNSGKINNLENLKSELNRKLYNFTRDRDKLDFLKILRQESVREKEEHKKICTKNICPFEEDRETGIFAIDQEIDSINRFYRYEPLSEDKFTPEEESELQCKLNEIVERLEKLGFGQEIIFDEIESLKNHFDLGKKNWFQLLKGKLIDLTIEAVIEKTIVAEIFSFLSGGFTHVIKMLDK